MRSVATCLVAALALAACGETESIDAVEPTPIAADGLPPDLNGAPVPVLAGPEPGQQSALTDADRRSRNQWAVRTMVGGPAALFGAAQSEALFVVRCEGNDLVFVRSVRLPAGPASMQVTIRGESYEIEAQSTPEPAPQVAGRLGIGEPLAQTLATTRDPIDVSIQGAPSLRVPASPQLREVVSGCVRTPDAGA
jgi:hypothetical protein